MRKNYTIKCLSQSRGPITHMSGTAGNEAIVAREPVIVDGEIRHVPFLSGNALRHRCVREPGMMWLIEQYGLRGELTLTQLNFLIHGGNLTESNAHENTARIAEMHRTWPLLKLIGGSLPNQILAGTMDVWRGSLVCRENARSIGSDFALNGIELLSSESMIGNYTYTRSDAAKLGIASQEMSALDPKSNLMIFSGQSVIAGSMFTHGFTVRGATTVELGALLWSLRLWKESGGTIGGAAAKGHGRLDTHLVDLDVAQDAVCQEYIDHAISMKDDAVKWLKACWSK